MFGRLMRCVLWVLGLRWMVGVALLVVMGCGTPELEPVTKPIQVPRGVTLEPPRQAEQSPAPGRELGDIDGAEARLVCWGEPLTECWPGGPQFCGSVDEAVAFCAKMMKLKGGGTTPPKPLDPPPGPGQPER